METFTRPLAAVLAILAILAASGSLPLASADDVVISEFMAINDRVLLDEDGNSSDWLEVNNIGSAPVNLDGWYLTDDEMNLTRWRLPAVQLEPGGFLVVFASGKDRAVPGSELHTSFALSGSGEFLALVRPDGTVAHAYGPLFPRQREDFSYGLAMDLRPLVSAGAPARILVPQGGLPAAEWRAAGFADGTWLAGSTGVGYDTAPGGAGSSFPAAYWDFDGTARDQSGQERHGQLVGGVTYSSSVPGAIGSGRSLRFDGQNDLATVPGYKGIGGGGARTIAAWIRTSQANGAIVSWGTNRPGQKWTFRVQSNNGTPGTIRQEVNGGYIVGNTAVNNGQWHHVAMVFPAGASANVNQVRLYVDGRLDASASGGPAPSALRARAIDTAAVADVRLGVDFASRFFSGQIDDVAIWDEALSGAQIAALASGASPLALKSFDPLIRTDLESRMRGVNGSALVRIPFTLAEAFPISSVSLELKYDDGFIAYLNGEEIARRNAPTVAAWNSSATLDRPDREAFFVESINVSGHAGRIEPGANVLAIHGLSAGRDDSDFLIVPELISAETLPGENRYFSVPTPGAPNRPGVIDFVADVTFSHDHGFYSAAFDLVLSSQTPGAVIRYTTSGTAPTETTGRVYNGPIRIVDTTTLRVGAFKAGHQPSYIDTRTYVFITREDGTGGVLHQPMRPFGFPLTWGTNVTADYEMDPRITTNRSSGFYDPRVRDALLALPSLSLVMDLDDLFDPQTGIYSNTLRSGVAWERPTSVELFFPDGRQGFQVNAGLRIQGGASRQTSRPKHNLRLLFKRIYGPGKLRYPVFQDSPVDRFDTIVLRGGNGDSWFHPRQIQQVRAQYIRDQWHRDTQLDMGRLSAHQNYMHLYINGLYWGVYHLIERPSAPFLAGHLGGEREDYDALNLGEPVDGDLQAWNTMMNISNQGLANPSVYAQIQQYLDIPNLIDWLLVNFYGGNVDWDHNNWYAGRRREPGAGYMFFSWDSERTFLGLRDNRTTLNNANRPTGLHTRLKANPEYLQLFADHVHRHFFNGGALTPAVARDRWMERAEEIELALVAEAARWGDDKRPAQPYTPQREWRTELNWFRNTYFPQRTGIVLQQLRGAGLYPSVAAPTFNRQGGELPVSGFVLTMRASSGVIHYTLNGTDPRLPGGQIASTAPRYTGGIRLTETSHVMARALRNGTWSALNEAIFAADVTPLHITEVMYHPRRPGAGSVHGTDDFEFFELRNTGDRVLDLSGVRFTEGIRFDFSAGAIASLQPGEYVLVVKDLEAFASRYVNADSLPVAGEYLGNLANGGEIVEIQNAIGAPIGRFEYDDAWHPTTDGDGFSLVIIDPEATPQELGNPASWRPGNVLDGTPGTSENDVVAGGRQLPSDGNQDTRVDLSDAIWLLLHLFRNEPPALPCGDGTRGHEANVLLLDASGDGGLDLGDAVFLLNFLFLEGPPPVAGTRCLRIPDCPDTCRG